MGHRPSPSGSLCAGWIQATPLGCRSDRAIVLNWTSSRAFGRTYATEEPILIIPRRGSAYRHAANSDSDTRSIRRVFIISRDNRDRCPDWVTRGQRQAPSPPLITRAGSIRLPCRPVTSRGYQQGDPSPYLISRALLEAHDFSYLTGYLTANAQGPSPPLTGSIRLSRRPDTIPCAGTVGSPDSLPFEHPSFRSVPSSENRRNHPRYDHNGGAALQSRQRE